MEENNEVKFVIKNIAIKHCYASVESVRYEMGSISKEEYDLEVENCLHSNFDLNKEDYYFAENGDVYITNTPSYLSNVKYIINNSLIMAGKVHIAATRYEMGNISKEELDLEKEEQLKLFYGLNKEDYYFTNNGDVCVINTYKTENVERIRK